ncbi:hypothetical protein AU106_gp004 [Sinorhizobium phage phiM9]|uniref:HD domain-containing protein n=1 Tax=Sinorhizobium phage phiM9 TaxID=1636182 RepID=A0A0F6R5P7_9CAUD|nr:hypothetical protein AU106_gp004 [Sinorhizobium phage phiM9]AKE44635.1 hypothetical protein Sm_phiM9_004 [Sinorhizobium phage phiM9]
MTDLLLKQFEVTRGSNTIVRNHTTVTNSPPNSYNVGNHVGGCVQTLLLCFPRASTALIRWMAFHDYSEYETGDIVGSAKVKHPTLGKVVKEIEDKIEEEYQILVGYDLTELEKIVVDYVDRAELLLWCFEQYEMGCRTKRFLNMMKRVDQKVLQLKNEFVDERPLQPSAYEMHLHDGVVRLSQVVAARYREANVQL